ncbi:MAG: hypothetical protein JXB23_14205 [Candidatus Aminicenantes bacterium]|nr:hypothetical protein [Candidatus Aminicenantes bacterium]
MEKYNSALLKLELLSQGIKIDPDIVTSSGSDFKEPLRQRAGVGSSGVDLILQEEVYVGAPAMEAFAKGSPFTLKKRGTDYVIEKNGRIVQKVRPFPRPAYYDKKTTDGTLMQRIGTIQGDFIGISTDNRCWFWGHYKEDEMMVYKGKQCKYCSIGLNLDTTEQPRKNIDQILQVIDAALKEKVCRHVALNAGAYPPPGTGHEENAEIIRKIKENFDSYVRLSLVPPFEEKYNDILREAGADQIGYNYEVFDNELYKKICPGKFELINEGNNHELYDRMIKYGVQKGGKSSIFSNLLVGLEPIKSTVAGIDHIASMGAVPRTFVFRALTGTQMENAPMSTVQDLVYVYRKLKEIVEEKYHLAFGCAGCSRVEVDTRKYLALVPNMPEITDDDLRNAGIKPESIG